MYYHFCLLCAFRPYLGIALGNSNVRPREICIQAAHSILTLAQCYDDLFTLRRVPGLFPYFICASGLFSVAMEDAGFEIYSEHSHANAPLEMEAEVKNIDSESSNYHEPAAPLHTKMASASHARLLLEKMGTTYPAAMSAEKTLREVFK